MAKRNALILGASGLVGGALLRILLNDSTYSEVRAVVRRPLEIRHTKLREHIIDFETLGAHKKIFAVDDVFCCLGTTIKQAGTRENFRRVDFHYPVEAAITAHAAGAQSYYIITAMGSNPRARIFYNRVKGETEEALSTIPFAALHIFRPSLLLGERIEKRPGERIAAKISSALPFLFSGPLKKYMPIDATVVARAMARAAQSGTRGVFIYESNQIQQMGGGHKQRA